MRYTIENEFIRLTVDSLARKWSAPSIWLPEAR